jgi:hypothetical protein
MSHADVAAIFDAAQVNRLARIVRLPDSADLAKFTADIQQAARIYLRDAGEPSHNEQRREIEALYQLLEQYVNTARLSARNNARSNKWADKLEGLGERLAVAVEALTPAVRGQLERRGAVIDDRFHTSTGRLVRDLPTAAEFRDPAARGIAVAHLRTLINVGGNWTEGRNRPSGRRSRAWKPVLHAPAASRGEPRREAERSLTMWLQIAVSDATGGRVARSADHRKPGPFARFAAEVLRLVGAAGPASAIGVAVEIINDLNRKGKARRDKTACHP